MEDERTETNWPSPALRGRTRSCCSSRADSSLPFFVLTCPKPDADARFTGFAACYQPTREATQPAAWDECQSRPLLGAGNSSKWERLELSVSSSEQRQLSNFAVPLLLSLRLAAGRLGSHTCYHFIECKAVSSSFRRHNLEAMTARAFFLLLFLSALHSAWLLLFPRAFSLGPRLKTGKAARGPVLFLARNREEERMIPRATKIEPKKAKGGP